MTQDEAIEACKAAANRLHHLSMVYVGAFMEIARGEPIGIIPSGTPGVKETRDLIDLLLYTRAEISGLTRLMVDQGVFTAQEYQERMAEEYDWFARQKSKQFGCTVTDYGLEWKTADEQHKRPSQN